MTKTRDSFACRGFALTSNCTTGRAEASWEILSAAAKDPATCLLEHDVRSLSRRDECMPSPLMACHHQL